MGTIEQIVDLLAILLHDPCRLRIGEVFKADQMHRQPHLVGQCLQRLIDYPLPLSREDSLLERLVLNALCLGQLDKVSLPRCFM